MASENVRQKLKQLLERGSNKDTFKEDIKLLQSWINFHCLTLQTFVVKGVSLAWLLVYPSPEKTEQIGQGEVRLVVNVDKTFELQVLRTVVKQHDIVKRENLLPYLHSFDCGSAYVICKGLNKEQIASLPYTPAHVRKWDKCDRLDSDSCLMWIEKNTSRDYRTKVSNIGTCKHCVQLGYYLTATEKRTSSYSTPEKDARTNPSSSCNFRYLTPRSLKNRHCKSRQEKQHSSISAYMYI